MLKIKYLQRKVFLTLMLKFIELMMEQGLAMQGSTHMKLIF